MAQTYPANNVKQNDSCQQIAGNAVLAINWNTRFRDSLARVARVISG